MNDCPDNLHLMENQIQSDWMQKAIHMAEGALRVGEVPVGCILVYKGNIIATGSNQVNETKNATRHAELVVIDKILQEFKNDSDAKNIFEQSVMYVTVEPCIMCTAALRQMCLKHIVYGCDNERFGGCGSVLDIHNGDIQAIGPKLECVPGCLKEEAVDILKKFYKGENINAPITKRKIKS